MASPENSDLFAPALKRLIADVIWRGVCDLHDQRAGDEPGKSYQNLSEMSGFETPREEIEVFWSPNRACLLYLDFLYQGEVDEMEIVEAVQQMDFRRSKGYSQKLSVAGDRIDGLLWQQEPEEAEGPDE